MAADQVRGERSKYFRKIAHDSLYRPGIDLAVVIAIGSAILDLVSLFLPWLVGINSEYLPGKGLSYSISVMLTGVDLFVAKPYLILLILPPVLSFVLLFISTRPEGIVPPRVSYKMKSRILILVAALSSMMPAYAFLNYFTIGIYLPPKPGVLVGRWELGGGATMPIWAGFGEMLALGLKIIKD